MPHINIKASHTTINEITHNIVQNKQEYIF